MDLDAQHEFIDSIAHVSRGQWQELANSDNPFIHYDYLTALENSGVTGSNTRWQPHHLIRRQSDGTIEAIVPIFLKQDSWGEFVFDFSWAEAHHRHGFAYYPKLVTAIPYTPVAGPRILQGSNDRFSADLANRIKTEAEQLNASSWHILFPHKETADALAQSHLIKRKDCQFHWFNKAYRSFDHYLEFFRSSRRKKTRRERRKVGEAQVVIKRQFGHQLDQEQWSVFYQLYASTFHKRGQEPYFTLEFFIQLSQSEDIKILIVWAWREGVAIAASLFFVSEQTLYGRYWGCREFVDGLHFELCYYQGIEYCIEHQIDHFDPGVQGEHKIARGFEAATSWSLHWIKQQEFAHAIADYVGREGEHIDEYMTQVDSHLPFKQSTDQET